MGVLGYKNTIIIVEIVSKANNLNSFQKTSFFYLLRLLPFYLKKEAIKIFHRKFQYFCFVRKIYFLFQIRDFVLFRLGESGIDKK